MNIDTVLKMDKELWMSPDLTGRFSEQDLDALGNWVWDGFNKDKYSRNKWEKRTQSAMDLAMQLQKDKNFPWPGCSNVAFPLVTIGALQFHSRAYPAIVQGRDIVRYRVIGEDQTGEETKRARMIGDHMSYQLLEEDHSWEEQHDRLLINIPIVGCAFKKSYFSAEKGHNVSELVLAQDLVMDYYAKSVESCARKTQIIPMYRNEIHSGIENGIYRDVRDCKWYSSNAVPLTSPSTIREDNRKGETPPQSDESTPFTFLEQHCWYDFDGDGYAEPYIITIEATSKCVVRIVARWDSERAIIRSASTKNIVKINPSEYYTKYGFIPSPDGGVYDVGFGLLLGPLNESVNSLINQLIDAGTMSNSAGGFLGRGAKIRGGAYTFAPLEWKRVDSTGDDLRKNIFPLPVRDPSAVLFQLLSLLINYTNRISGTTDTLVGENPGQNTPAQTTQTMVEQGQKIYAAIFKRVWRSMKEEFRKLYLLNAVYMPTFVEFGESGQKALRDYYQGNPDRIVPVADPNVTSDVQRIQQAQVIKQNAAVTPGYDLEEVERRFLRAMHVDSIDVIYPGPGKVPPLPNPKVMVEQLKTQVKMEQLKLEKAQFAASMQEEMRVNNAKILQLEAQAAKLIEEAGGVRVGHQIAAFEAAIGALKSHDQELRARVEGLMKSMEEDRRYELDKQTADREGMAGMAGASGDKTRSLPAPG